ncbi:carbohydrate ABC transporter permease [Paenibacillus eucommiae]|uniref:Multiple sugar transport system permease protein n=1 Tax=Paenibacillus eucommiae TaxID=1355755 RepID=A0ABS4J6V4_9BACL|nr:sugar ABC transporter permease [Paenibacillus eucommiae]MBP1994514.1 multiple sugar transport system permease protein [Paenibacillus eucommiae]
MRKEARWGYILTLPFSIQLLVFFAFPFFFSLYLTFTQWDMFNLPVWIGASNWIRLLDDKSFWYSLRNVLMFAVIFVPLQTIMALVLAFSLNQAIRAKSLYRVIYFLPVVTPWLAGGTMWVWMMNKTYGLANYLLGIMSISPVNWLDSKHWAIPIMSVALVNVWKGVGSSMVILLAAIQGVSKDLYEAASLEGASRRALFWHIVFPIVSPMVFLVLVLSTISAFQAFDVFLIMFDTLNNVPDSKVTPNILIYKDAFLTNKMGYASAMSWALFMVILAVTLLQKYFEKRWVHYE